MKDYRKVLSQNIKAERVRNNLSQQDVADKLGISRETYNRYEQAQKIDATILYELSNIFNCKIDAFYLNFNTTICGE